MCNSASANHSEGFFFFAWQISRTSANCSLRSSLLSDVSSVYLSYAFCKRSLMRENNAKAFVRGGHLIMYPFGILGTHFSAMYPFSILGTHFSASSCPCIRLKCLCVLDSMEGHGDVLQDLGGGEAGPPTGVVLQAPLGLAQVLQLSAPRQPSHPRSIKSRTPFDSCLSNVYRDLNQIPYLLPMQM